MNMTSNPSIRLERVLWAIGAALAGYCLFIGVRARAYDQTAQNMFQSSPLTPVAHGILVSGARRGNSPIVGHLDIPALSLSVAVLSDFESSSLLKGVGHIQGTAQPGGLGTVGLVGHRDTFFRPLREIAVGMQIRLTDRGGTYLYAVDSTEIVTPDQVSVLDIRNRPGLALVTCYPFDFVGAAPKRFVVHAHLVSLVPELKSSPSRSGS
jgi:sortase A